MTAPTTAFGLTVTGATSTLTINITDLNPPSATRESLDSSHQGTTDNARTFIGSSLVDYGELSGSGFIDPTFDFTVPMVAANETWTLTYNDGTTTDTTWAFDGFLMSYEPSGTLDNLITVDFSIKVSGKPTITAGS